MFYFRRDDFTLGIKLGHPTPFYIFLQALTCLTWIISITYKNNPFIFPVLLELLSPFWLTKEPNFNTYIFIIGSRIKKLLRESKILFFNNLDNPHRTSLYIDQQWYTRVSMLINRTTLILFQKKKFTLQRLWHYNRLPNKESRISIDKGSSCPSSSS